MYLSSHHRDLWFEFLNQVKTPFRQGIISMKQMDACLLCIVSGLFTFILGLYFGQL